MKPLGILLSLGGAIGATVSGLSCDPVAYAAAVFAALIGLAVVYATTMREEAA